MTQEQQTFAARSEQEKRKMLEDISELEDLEQRLNADLGASLESLKELNNEYQTLIGSIRVNVRVRPALGTRR